MNRAVWGWAVAREPWEVRHNGISSDSLLRWQSIHVRLGPRIFHSVLVFISGIAISLAPMKQCEDLLLLIRINVMKGPQLLRQQFPWGCHSRQGLATCTKPLLRPQPLKCLTEAQAFISYSVTWNRFFLSITHLSEILVWTLLSQLPSIH